MPHIIGIIPIWLLFALNLRNNYRYVTCLRSYKIEASSSSSSSSMTQVQAQAAVLKISYDGTHFNGWSAANDDNSNNGARISSKQYNPEEENFPCISARRKCKEKHRRPQVRSVEGTIKKALQKLYGNIDIDLVDTCGCSRTDRGVHARHMIIAFSSGNRPLPFNGDLRKLVYVLNRMLPFDVRIQNVCLLPAAEFHPTVDAISKTYIYNFSVGTHPDPLRWRHEWQIEGHRQFDLNRAKTVAGVLKGTHDFSAFRGAFRGNERGKYKDPVCTIYDIDIKQATLSELNLTSPPLTDKLVGSNDASNSYVIKVRGNRFLYKMMRYLSGTIVSAGLGKLFENEVESALAKGKFESNVANNMSCAPANGLILSQVEYDQSIEFQWVY